jgi:hypothetical protein
MAELTQAELQKEAEKVLKKNDRGKFTVPAGDLYPHQWLWDSCFIAIGLRHKDIDRAQVELQACFADNGAMGCFPTLFLPKEPSTTGCASFGAAI